MAELQYEYLDHYTLQQLSHITGVLTKTKQLPRSSAEEAECVLVNTHFLGCEITSPGG